MASNFHNQQAPIYDIDVNNAEIDIISFLLHGHHQYENNEYWLKINEKLFISPVAKKIFQVLEKLNIEGKIQVNLATVSNELRQLCANQDSLLNSCFAFLQQTSPDFNYYEIGEQINILKISNQKQEITKLFQQVQTTPLTISNSANYFSK